MIPESQPARVLSAREIQERITNSEESLRLDLETDWFRDYAGNTSRHQISETSLWRLVKTHGENGYIAVCAWRKAPIEGVAPEEQLKVNKQNDLTLRRWLRGLDVSFLPVVGGYKESGSDAASSEPSYVVFPKSTNRVPVSHRTLIDIGKQICRRFDQDSFLYKPAGNEKAYYINRDGQLLDQFSGTKFNDPKEKFFTHMKGRADRRYTLTNPTPPATAYADSVVRECVFWLIHPPHDVQEAIGRRGELFINVNSYAHELNAKSEPEKIVDQLLDS